VEDDRGPGPMGLDDLTFDDDLDLHFPGEGTRAPDRLQGGGDTSGSPELTRWPAVVSWGMFREMSTRPTGEREDARIRSEMVSPSEVAYAREGRRYRLGHYVMQLHVNTDNSWVVTEWKSSALLAHEQGHFDITGLIARDLVQRLRNLRTRSTEALGREVLRLYEVYNRWAGKVTQEYDDETRHGKDAERQRGWETRIQTSIQNGSSLGRPPR
jgi:hypothetical protein